MIEMSTREKANDILIKYLDITPKQKPYDLWKYQAKECAIIAVEEIINEYSGYRIKHYVTLEQALELRKYWEEVKSELEKL